MDEFIRSFLPWIAPTLLFLGVVFLLEWTGHQKCPMCRKRFKRRRHAVKYEVICPGCVRNLVAQ